MSDKKAFDVRVNSGPCILEKMHPKVESFWPKCLDIVLTSHVSLLISGLVWHIFLLKKICESQSMNYNKTLT